VSTTKHRLRIPHRPARQFGISLIEVLVALVVISIGLLGVVGLQLTGVQGNYLSYQYMQATTLAQSLADKMQSNPTGLLDNNYALTAGTVPAAPATDCWSATCSPADQAAWDLALIYRTATGEDYGTNPPAMGPTEVLPAAALSVTCAVSPCGDDDVRVVTVYWDAERNGATGYACDPDDSDDLRCVRIPVSP